MPGCSPSRTSHERGCGLSDRDVGEDAFTLDRWVRDLETVVDAAGLDRFALLGLSQGAALAIEYMARNPGRITHFIVCGGFARGRARRDSVASAEENETLAAMIRVGWGKSNAAFRRTFTTMFLPEGTPEQIEWFDDLQRVSATPETASRIFAARGDLDVTARAPMLDVPTLVMHAREDAVVPFAEGRLIASLIPGARFVPLDGRNHVLLETEPAWGEFLSAVDEFLGSGPAAPAPSSNASRRIRNTASASTRPATSKATSGSSGRRWNEGVTGLGVVVRCPFSVGTRWTNGHRVPTDNGQRTTDNDLLHRRHEHHRSLRSGPRGTGPARLHQPRARRRSRP